MIKTWSRDNRPTIMILKLASLVIQRPSLSLPREFCQMTFHFKLKACRKGMEYLAGPLKRYQLA